jgi:trigger factor
LSSTETLAHATPKDTGGDTAIAAQAENSADTQSQTEGLEQAHDHNHDHNHDHAPAEQGPAMNPECVRDVDVVIPADEVSSAFRRIVKNYGRQARIPGFRAGKVPPTLIRSRFDEQIRQDVVEQLLPQHFRAAIEAKGLQPISQPQVTELELKDGEPLRFKALFEVLPEFALDGWQEVHIPREPSELTEQEFDAEMERMLDSRSTMEPVEEDRELADGDFAQISFTGAVALGEEIGEPIVGEDVSLEVGGKNTLPAFTDALRGTKPGQELKFEVTYPEDFGEARLAGRTVAYDVEVKAIKHRISPELNDELAKELGDYETMDDFKAKLREHLGAEKKRQSEAATKDKILEALADKYTFPIPESMVATQIDARLDRGLRALAQQGMSQEQMRTLDFARLRAAQRDAALGEVQGTMLLDRVAQAENVEVEAAELDRELEMLSVQMQEPLETLRERLEKDGSVARVREQIRREKTGALLYEKLSS